MTRTLLFSLLFAYGLMPARAQNLIPNGSFEIQSSYDCPGDPISGFRLVEDWSTYDTPHLYRYGCRFDENLWSFFSPSLRAYEGQNNIGLISVLLVDGSLGSTRMDARLTEPIIPGQQYYFQLHASNRGVGHHIPDSLTICETDPPKRIQVYLGDEFLLDSVTYTPTEPEFAFTSPELQSTEKSDWIQFSHCFQGVRPDTHFSIGLNDGEVDMSLPCIERDLGFGLYYFTFNFRVDELILYPIPEKIDTLFQSCNRREFRINLMTIADVPLGTDIEFQWADDYVGFQRVLSTPGIYQIEAKLPCASFPIEVTIEDVDCHPVLYAPTAFTPNGDGHNDQFIPIIEAGYPIQAFSFQVFDRWGNKIFESFDPQRGWDGFVGGISAQAGVYTWVVRFNVSSDTDSVPFQEGGSVTLVR